MIEPTVKRSMGTDGVIANDLPFVPLAQYHTYAVALFARRTPQPATHENCSLTAAWLIARNDTAAELYALTICRDQCPPAAGWIDHQAAIQRLPDPGEAIG